MNTQYSPAVVDLATATPGEVPRVLVPPPTLPRTVFSALYYMVKPDRAAARAADALRAEIGARHGLQGNAVEPDRQHVTLHELGSHPELPAGLVERALQAGAAVAAEPFDVEFDRAVGWGAEAHLLALAGAANGLRGLRALQRSVAVAMVDAGLGEWVRHGFRPHISLFYGNKTLPSQAIEPIRWTIDELLLVESLDGAGVHRVLGRWPLLRRQAIFDW
jgi:2'-5' RNA ligase